MVTESYAELVSLTPLRVRMVFTECWPPSVNNITAVVHGRKIKSKAGRDFTAFIKSEIERFRTKLDIPKFTGRVGVILKLHAKTNGRYDIDNKPKAVEDSMTASNIWIDDEQVDLLIIKRCRKQSGGGFSITIMELPPGFGDDDE